jgi:hypothetical protein
MPVCQAREYVSVIVMIRGYDLLEMVQCGILRGLPWSRPTPVWFSKSGVP